VDRDAGYEYIDDILAGCYADASETPKVQIKGRADRAIGRLCNLSCIESEVKGCRCKDRSLIRLKIAQPLLDQLNSWLDRSALQVLPKSAIGTAVASSLGQWGKSEC